MRWALQDVMTQLFDPQFGADQIPALLEKLESVASEINSQVRDGTICLALRFTRMEPVSPTPAQEVGQPCYYLARHEKELSGAEPRYHE